MGLVFTYVLVIGYIGVTMYLANQAEMARRVRDYHREEDRVTIYDMDHRKLVNAVKNMLYAGVVLIAMFVPLMILATLDVEGMEASGLTIRPIDGFIGVIVALACAGGSVAVITSAGARGRLARLIGTRGAYDVRSMVHTTAIVLTALLLTAQIVQFLAGGGAEGLSQSIEQTGIDPMSVLLQMFLQVAAAFLGVGYAIRRGWPDSLERLGLRPPTEADWRWGVGVGFALLGLLYLFGIVVVVLQALFGGGIEDASSANTALTMAFATVPLALLVSFSASVGEEILFRGALQPIFGNVAVSVVFALLHTQALFSIGLIFLFAVSMVFGWLRDRFSTTAAIIAHFVYNFVQLLLAIALIQSGGLA